MNRSRSIALFGPLFLLASFYAHTQNFSRTNLRQKTVRISQDTILVAENFIFPNTIKFFEDQQVLPLHFIVKENTLLVDSLTLSQIIGKTLKVQYRILDFELNRAYSHLDSSVLEEKERAIPIAYDLTSLQIKNKNQALINNGLEYNGSFSRGFSFGNSQSLVLNSNFNLQLSGDLGNDLKITAAISDENLPIQPEGNTQLLQEFDRVYIKVQKKEFSVLAGDYDLASTNSYFMKYFKKLQGLQLSYKTENEENFNYSGQSNFAVSRGKFARFTLPVQEGNQGPYMLRGSDGERIFRVLSGSEKVYIDGVPVVRGLENDYIISYDRAEIQFMSKQLITKDKRVIIEFEYSDQNYLRSQYGANLSLQTQKWNAYLNMYSEQDSRSVTGDIDLDTMDLRILNDAGDNFENLFRSGIRVYDPNLDLEQSLYIKVFEPSITDSILVFEADPEKARYIVSFSDQGQGSGSYIIDPTIAANGRAYRWVGDGNGSFEPKIELIPPERKQMLNLGGEYKFTENTQIFSEFAFSNTDLNRFSNEDNEDNAGIAYKGKLQHAFPLSEKEKGLVLGTSASLEWLQNDFTFLNPYRNAEFSRNWNISDSIGGNELLTQFEIHFAEAQSKKIAYVFDRYTLGTKYVGTKHNFYLNYIIKGLHFQSNSSFLNNLLNENPSKFSRPNLRIEKTFQNLGGWKTGVFYEEEKNERRLANNVSLESGSFRFQYFSSYIKSPSDKSFGMRLAYNKRIDYLTPNKIFEQSAIANEIEWSSNWSIKSHSILNFNFKFRDLNINESISQLDQSRRSYLGRLDYSLKIWNGGLRSNSSYEINAGQEARKEFEYVKVQKGEGQYIWLDDGDGIQEVNEFQLSPVQDTSDFIRVTILNNEFIRTTSNSLNQSIRLEGRNIFQSKRTSKNIWFRALTKLSLLSNFRVQSKIEDTGENATRFLNFSDTIPNLVNFSFLSNHTLYFNKGNPKYDVQFGNRNSSNTFVQISGFESSARKEWFSRIRWNYRKGADLILNGTIANQSAASESFVRNEYDIDILKINPEFIFRPSNNLRFTGIYSFSKRKNKNPENEAIFHDLGIESTIRTNKGANFRSKFSFVQVSVEEIDNPNLELVLLEGLRKGKNYLWEINYTKRMSNNIDLIFSYDGRKTGDSRTIHGAKAQVRANF